MHDQQRDLEALLRVIRRRAWIVVLCAVLAAGAAYLYSRSQPKEYTAQASILFGETGFDQALFRSDSNNTQTDPEREAATTVKLVSSSAVAVRTADALNLPSPDSVTSHVEVASEGQSNLVSVKATERSPATAARLANTFARQYILSRRAAQREKLDQAQQVLQRRLDDLGPVDQASPQAAQAKLLSTRAEELRLLKSLQTGGAELAVPARRPESASSPNTTLNTIIGAVAGLLIGLGLAVLLERLNRRLVSPEDLGAALEGAVLTAVPECRSLGGGGKRGLSRRRPRDRQAWEAFRMLRARLRHADRPEIFSLLVTSPGQGEGRTTVAWHLALAAATSGSQVVLVEADLRRPAIARRHGLETGPGLADVLHHDVPLKDVIQTSSVGNWPPGENSKGADFSVIAAGAVRSDAAELIEGATMTAVLDQLRSDYDLVVIDAPPTAQVSDAVPLIDQLDGVLVVGWVGETTIDSAEALREQLDSLGAESLGVVANRVAVKGARQRTYPDRTSATVAEQNGHRSDRDVEHDVTERV